GAPYEASTSSLAVEPVRQVALSPDYSLSYLYALHEIDTLVKRLAARAAGASGATYVHLGAA
ncbi:hypothetical protein ACWGQ5_56615, partial [Streptomyces sp. NPDC055722]